MNNLINMGVEEFMVVISCLVGKINWRLEVFLREKNWMSDTNTLPLCPIWRLGSKVSILLHHVMAGMFFMWLSNLDETVQPLECGTACQVTAAWLVCFPINNPDFAHLTAYCTPKSKCLDLKVRHDVFVFDCRLDQVQRCFGSIRSWIAILVLQCYVYI